MANESYYTHAKGLRIVPGSWRPHYAWEHIGWVSPSWPSQDYVWLDFPEAIFTAQGLHYLSHINPSVPALYADWPRLEWDSHDNGISFQRVLPSGVSFGGNIMKATDNRAKLELYIRNDSPEALTNIKLQTCCFLRACREFADYTMDNKFIHVPGDGWVPFSQAIKNEDPQGTVKVGWRGGPAHADRPMMACRSNQAERFVVMSWGEHTLSLIGNSAHPCLHADPKFPDLEPGKHASITGVLLFHEGPLAELPASL